MPAYLVKLDATKSGYTLVGGKDAMIVFASSETQAKEIAAAEFDGDGRSWLDDATATEVEAAADFEGWTFRVEIFAGFGDDGLDPARVTVVGDETNNTIDEIAELLVTALNALDGIAAADYNATSNTLTIAETTDALGDQTVSVKITPPGGKSPIPSLVGTITDEGAEADALTVVLPADAAVIPTVLAAVGT